MNGMMKAFAVAAGLLGCGLAGCDFARTASGDGYSGMGRWSEGPDGKDRDVSVYYRLCKDPALSVPYSDPAQEFPPGLLEGACHDVLDGKSFDEINSDPARIAREMEAAANAYRQKQGIPGFIDIDETRLAAEPTNPDGSLTVPVIRAPW